MYLKRNDRSPGARIAGFGVCLPDQMVTSAELEEAIRRGGIDCAEGFIERATGIRSRGVAAEGQNASDLAVAAGRSALAQAGIGVDDVDVLLFAAASHDVTEPATANIVQAKLGARNALVFDIKNACNSILTGLDVADAFVGSGRAGVVLLVTGEMPSRAVRMNFVSHQDVTERFAHLTFGDAGGALVLTPAAKAGQGILAVAGVSRGEAWKLATILSFGTLYPRDTYPEGGYFASQSHELEQYGMRDIPPVLRTLLDAVDWTADNVEVIAGHQHTQKLAHQIASEIGFPLERVMLPLKYAGNAVSANVPLALAEAQERGLLQSGTRVNLCGGSAGFSALAAAVSW